MQPERKTEVNGQTIKEYYWAGSYPCYVNSILVEHNYDEAVRRAENSEPILQHSAYR